MLVSGSVSVFILLVSAKFKCAAGYVVKNITFFIFSCLFFSHYCPTLRGNFSHLQHSLVHIWKSQVSVTVTGCCSSADRLLADVLVSVAERWNGFTV